MPLDIFLTINEELRPAFLIFITTPSKACSLDLFPSCTLTVTTTVSPGLKGGISSLSCELSTDLMMLAGVSSDNLAVIAGSSTDSSTTSALSASRTVSSKISSSILSSADTSDAEALSSEISS